MNDSKLFQWQMIRTDGELIMSVSDCPVLGSGEVLVKVAGCGVCHTDLSFWHYGVHTKHELPLTLGHEISGTVVGGDQNWLHKKVIVPAVLPCGECELCKRGRSNICRNQLMPGNDFHGGFASHVIVPSKYLCEVPESVLANFELSQLAVIADAVSTPYQVIDKSELETGDLAIMIGVGGVGIFGALLAKINGAKVIALDVREERLKMAKENGIDNVINIESLEPKIIKEKIKAMARELGAPAHSWKIYEFSGTKQGQELAFNLITYASTLSIVGFTLEKLEIRLSNLMAFDAKLIGTWGCRAELYPGLLRLLESNQLNISPFIQTLPMSNINEVFKNTLQHKYQKRTVLVPDFL